MLIHGKLSIRWDRLPSMNHVVLFSTIQFSFIFSSCSTPKVIWDQGLSSSVVVVPDPCHRFHLCSIDYDVRTDIFLLPHLSTLDHTHKAVVQAGQSAVQRY